MGDGISAARVIAGRRPHSYCGSPLAIFSPHPPTRQGKDEQQSVNGDGGYVPGGRLRYAPTLVSAAPGATRAAAAQQRLLAAQAAAQRALGLDVEPTDDTIECPAPQFMRAAEPALGALLPSPPGEGPAPADSRLALSKREGKALKRAVRVERDAAELRALELRRWRDRWEARGSDPMKRPPLISREQWGTARAIVHSPAAARAALQWLARHHGGAVAARVCDAAFQGGRWDLTDLPARKFIALATFMYQQARLHTWGRTAAGAVQLGLCMRGVGRGALCAMLADPHAHEPMSVSALSSWSERWSGYLVRGTECLVWDAVQVPAQVAEQWEVGPTGYTCNRYWLCSSRINKPALDMSHALDTAAEHERGWALAFAEETAARADEMRCVPEPEPRPPA